MNCINENELSVGWASWIEELRGHSDAPPKPFRSFTVNMIVDTTVNRY